MESETDCRVQSLLFCTSLFKMMRGSKTPVFLINQSGKLLDVQCEIVARLKKRLQIQEVDLVDKCDVIIAFVPIVSRAGTDIEAALRYIPTTKPAALIVLHNTFDVHYIAPQSKYCVNRDGVFAADFLCHEDAGLLKCLANEEALESIIGYVISVAPSTPLLPVNRRQRKNCWICVTVGALAIPLIGLLLYFLIQRSQ